MVVTVIIAALVACGLGWWFLVRNDHQLEVVRQLQADAFRRENRDLSEEQRRAKFQQYREAYDKLSEAQQRALRQERSRGMQGRMTGQIRTYFELPEPQRVAFLDKQINEIEKRRREFANRGRDGGSRAERSRGGPGGPAAGRGGPPGSSRGNLENNSDADRQERRDQWRRRFLDHTTPKQRAEMAEFMSALRERREQRGLPDFGRSGRGR